MITNCIHQASFTNGFTHLLTNGCIYLCDSKYIKCKRDFFFFCHAGPKSPKKPVRVRNVIGSAKRILSANDDDIDDDLGK